MKNIYCIFFISLKVFLKESNQPEPRKWVFFQCMQIFTVNTFVSIFAVTSHTLISWVVLQSPRLLNLLFLPILLVVSSCEKLFICCCWFFCLFAFFSLFPFWSEKIGLHYSCYAGFFPLFSQSYRILRGTVSVVSFAACQHRMYIINSQFSSCCTFNQVIIVNSSTNAPITKK